MSMVVKVTRDGYECNRYFVQVFEGGWVDCVREDLLEEPPYNGDSRNLPPASFFTRAEAESFIATVRGMMHCGGGDTQFRISGLLHA